MFTLRRLPAYTRQLFLKWTKRGNRRQIHKYIGEIIISSIALTIVDTGLIAILYLALSGFEIYRNLVSDVWIVNIFVNLIALGAIIGSLLGIIFGGFEITFRLIPPKEERGIEQPASWILLNFAEYSPTAGRKNR